jgi:RHH-type proline utilization regulon transcriptional repressor/proline dehydrogenase/delta 1-pyrroline-5-carboxylate dehydrogenase
MEERIREIGAELFSSLEKETPSLFDQRRWKGRITQWAMKDEAFKTQLFRFVDVLPALTSDELVVRLFREYFEGFEDAPFLIRQGLKRIISRFPSASASLIRSSVESLARQFIAGNDPQDALPYLKSLVEDGAALSVDLLGEAVLSDAEADRYGARYLELLDFLHPHFGGLDISLKVTSFYSQLEPLNQKGSIEKTRESLMPVFGRARALGASVTFDMEHYYLKDLTLAIFRSALDELRDFPGAGIAMQAYLRDTREDLQELVRWAKERGRRIAVRLVKGAYWDYETVINRLNGWPVPVFLDKAETDRNFEELTAVLMENAEHVYPAIASHNIRSISVAIAHAERLGLPEDAFEFQTLYGMGEPIRRALKSTPYRVRVYSPVGKLLPGMAYLVRRLLENTSNESFLRKSFAEKASFEDVMLTPAPSIDTAEQEPEGFRNEPPADFSRAENRERMNEALLSVREDLGRSFPLVIGGEEVTTENRTLSLNPAKPEEVIGRVSQASTGEAERAVREARRAWDTWRHTPAKERAGYLFRAAEEMRKRRFELAALEVYEVGKPIFEADGDVAEAIDYLQYYGREMLRLAEPRRLSRLEGEEDTYLYEPRGVGVVISPWNFPLAIPTGMATAAIVTGNCAILKPSGLSPVTAWQLVDIFRTVGLPKGVLQYLPGPGGVVGEYLVSHPGVDFIVFTGSMDVGLGIVRLASDTRAGQRSVKRVVAEMGGWTWDLAS